MDPNIDRSWTSFWEGFGSVLGGFWEGLGRVLGGFWEGLGRVLGGVWKGFGRGLGHFGRILRGLGTLWALLGFFARFCTYF